MKLSKHQQGFAAVEAILIVIVLGIIGFTGWFVYYSKQNTDKTLTAAANSSTPSAQKSTLKNQSSAEQTPAKTPVTTPSSSSSTSSPVTYLSISQWGIKVGFKDADKVTYTAPADEYNWSNIEHTQSVSLYLKSSVTSSQECQNLQAKIYKYPDMYSADIYPHWTVDEGNNDAYTVVLPPASGFGACSGGTTTVTNLRSAIISTELSKATMDAL